ncbi:hypothetical protein A1O3_10046 [Capronia epimyces CBS 606.96]|uniref:Uncharacterized protein n=1 Tax=Capronia epimyces CBS 606.96 TaxID=1182542 RepID=W9Y374_9EURO|nr:uncharacterized protein A1O3_10046 [Capronia epimyces CBS 606.96]EXJ76889.1 hypothetical protein A1O3_10046 [Capronia epimyces CBS 606.96]
MEWIRGWNKAPVQETFRVKTKLNSEEAVRRFNTLRQEWALPMNRMIELCREEGVDKRLEEELEATMEDLSLSKQLLSEHCVGEREYLGTAVLKSEGMLSKTKDLLLRVDLAQRTRQRLPHGFHLRVQALTTQLGEGRRLLVSMRHKVEEESHQTAAGEGAGSARGTGWAYLSGNTKGVAEEHHEREHLFTGLGWRQPQRCRCLDYR